jgi:hypothetical protein
VQAALAIRVADQGRADVVGGDVRHVHHANLAAALDQGHDGALLLGNVALEVGTALARALGIGISTLPK